MITNELKNAFRWHMQNMPRFRHGFGEGLDVAPRAVFALAMARRDIAAGINRYPAPLKPFPAFGAADADGRRWTDDPKKAGLRLVGRVMPECGGRNGIWDSTERCGWYADEFQDDIAFGLVYQLPGRNGESRFVAGYAFREDEGITLDLSRVYAEPAAEFVKSKWGGYFDWQDNPGDMDAAHDAARAGDGMARIAAESELEYKTAWRAGSMYADLADDISATRKELLGLLKERRAAMANAALSDAGYFRLCDAIRSKVAELLSDISKARQKRDELRQGEYRNLQFWTGDARLADAFNDGAGESVLPC